MRHDPDVQIPFDATNESEVALYLLVAELNATSVRERLGVIVGVRRPDDGAPFVRFVGPTGWHSLRFVGERDVTPLDRVKAHADGFFAATREHHAARAA
jgi:hypothetical protein